MGRELCSGEKLIDLNRVMLAQEKACPVTCQSEKYMCISVNKWFLAKQLGSGFLELFHCFPATYLIERVSKSVEFWKGTAGGFEDLLHDTFGASPLILGKLFKQGLKKEKVWSASTKQNCEVPSIFRDLKFHTATQMCLVLYEELEDALLKGGGGGSELYPPPLHSETFYNDEDRWPEML